MKYDYENLNKTDVMFLEDWDSDLYSILVGFIKYKEGMIDDKEYKVWNDFLKYSYRRLDVSFKDRKVKKLVDAIIRFILNFSNINKKRYKTYKMPLKRFDEWLSKKEGKQYM